MKIRTDFVTNSSSSSFIIATTKENFDKVVEDLHPAFKALAEQMFSADKIFGRDCMVATTWSNHGGDWSEFFELNYDGEYPEDCTKYEFICEGFDKICNLLRKDPDAVFTHSVDM